MKNTFCNSPWLHLRINYNGDYKPCRWFPVRSSLTHNIKDIGILEYWNTDEMRELRSTLVKGQSNNNCENCYYQDQNNTLSGRHRQLIKSAIDPYNFDNTFANSPHYKHFLESYVNEGHTTKLPTDLQIEVGSTCNSACLMCWPRASSRLAQDYRKLNNIDNNLFAYPDYPPDWTKDKSVFDNFLDQLVELDIKYIHLLGGETLYIDKFYDIANAVASPNIILGTTTNGTIYNSQIEELIPKFEEFHLGISVEAFTSINDYVRYPSQWQSIQNNILKYKKLQDTQAGLQISLRITPSLLTIADLHTVFAFCIEHDIIAESCHILTDPKFLRMEYLPKYLRECAIDNLKGLVSDTHVLDNTVNIRDKKQSFAVTQTSIRGYIEFLNNIREPTDVESTIQTGVRYLKAFESLRNNSLHDCNPELADWLGRYGYN